MFGVKSFFYTTAASPYIVDEGGCTPLALLDSLDLT